MCFSCWGLISQAAARWAVSEPNMMNVAATRAKKEFYIIGDKKLYLGLGCDVVTDTERVIRQYKKQFPELVKDSGQDQATPIVKEESTRISGMIRYVGKGTKYFYAYVAGDDGKEYSITENIYAETDHAKEVIRKGNKVSFIPQEGKKKTLATNVKGYVSICDGI